MRSVLSLTLFSLSLTACPDNDCGNTSEKVTLPGLTAAAVPESDMCCNGGPAGDLCESHPYGRAPYCNGIEEPQTVEACEALTERNPDLCAHEYVLCREAIRVAPCDVCPPECAGIDAAC